MRWRARICRKQEQTHFDSGWQVLEVRMASETFNSGAISMGIALNDARLWHGSTDTGIMAHGQWREKIWVQKGMWPRKRKLDYAMGLELREHFAFQQITLFTDLNNTSRILVRHPDMLQIRFSHFSDHVLSLIKSFRRSKFSHLYIIFFDHYLLNGMSV